MRTPRDNRSASLETELLIRVRSGDRAAFTELYRRMSHQLLRYVLNRVIDHAQAEEVLQEVFLEVWQNAARFDPARAKASAWMHAIAHHKAVDRIRTAQRARDRDYRVGIRDWDPVDHTITDRLDHDPGALETALSVLTPLQREAIMLRYLHDLSVVETAQLLGVNAATAKTRIRDGLLRLHNDMAPTNFTT